MINKNVAIVCSNDWSSSPRLDFVTCQTTARQAAACCIPGKENSKQLIARVSERIDQLKTLALTRRVNQVRCRCHVLHEDNSQAQSKMPVDVAVQVPWSRIVSLVVNVSSS